MAEDKKINETQKIEVIESLFQEAMSELKKLHNEKLELIKKFRTENNFEELNKIRESFKEQA
jgi:cellobiose-specific phosphotransferase system component IIA